MSRRAILLCVSLAASLALPARAAALAPPNPRLLTADGINDLVGQRLDELDTVSLAIYHSWRVAVIRNNRRFSFYQAFPQTQRDGDEADLLAARVFLEANREAGVWGLLFLVDAGPHDSQMGMRDDGAPREQFAELLKELVDETCTDVLKLALTTPGTA